MTDIFRVAAAAGARCGSVEADPPACCNGAPFLPEQRFLIGGADNKLALNSLVVFSAEQLLQDRVLCAREEV